MRKNKPKFKQIIDAAVVVIAENGYHQAQVSKIAKQAGVADGTIYLYFKNKEDILVSVFQEKMGEHIESVHQALVCVESPIEKLFVFVEKHFHLFENNKKLASVTQLELRQSNKELRVQINVILRSYLTIIENIVEEAIEKGEFRTDIDVRLIKQMIFGTIDEMVTTWVMKEQKYNLLAITSQVHQLLIRGLLQ